MKLIKITDKNIHKYQEDIFNNDVTKKYLIENLLETNSFYTQENFDIINSIMKKHNMYIHEINIQYGNTRVCHNHYNYSNQCNKFYLSKEELKDLKEDLKNIREELKNHEELWNFKPYLSFKTVKDLEESLYHFFYEFESYYPDDEFIKEEIKEFPERFESFVINPKTKEIYQQL